MSEVPSPLSGRDRVVVVCGPDRLCAQLASRYPALEVVGAGSYLSGMAEAARAGVVAALVYLTPAARRAASLVRGYRQAMGSQGRLVLICEPLLEPVAREAAEAGADDYLIDPPTEAELDAVLGIPPESGAPSVAAGLTAEEVERFSALLRSPEGSLRAVLQRLADLVRESMRASSVTVTASGVAARSGEASAEPVLRERIVAGGQTAGQILVGPRPRIPYTETDHNKLRMLARLAEGALAVTHSVQHWQRLAYVDDLTGLYNRRYVEEFLPRLVERARRRRERITVLMFDIDHFKTYNDRFGHSAGDEILRATGQLFTQNCRRTDVVTRYGGDEFVVVFWDAEQPRVAGSEHPKSVMEVLERFRAALAEHTFDCLGPGGRGVLTISGGLAGFPWDAQTAEELLNKADQALLAAKRSGKNRIFLVGREAEGDVSGQPRSPGTGHA